MWITNLTDATSGAGNAYPFEAPEFTLGFKRVGVTRFLVLCVMFCRSLFVLLSIFFWPLNCLPFFDLRTPLVSPNSSSYIVSVVLHIKLNEEQV